MGVSARAIVTLEVDCKSSWSEETTVRQVRKQAEEDARQELRLMLNEFQNRIKLVGEIKITVVHFEANK